MAIIKNKRLLLLRDELISEIEKKSYPESAYTQELLKRPFDHDQVVQALEIYGAFRRPVERYQLAGVSVRCFDLPTLISMSILGTVSGQYAFQCNPCLLYTSSGKQKPARRIWRMYRGMC